VEEGCCCVWCWCGLCDGVNACLQDLPCEILSRIFTHLMLGASPALAFARRPLRSAGHLVLDGVELRHLSVGARRVRKDNGSFTGGAHRHLRKGGPNLAQAQRHTGQPRSIAYIIAHGTRGPDIHICTQV
jgi:hypothetical protein